jgi:hypothetical protein
MARLSRTNLGVKRLRFQVKDLGPPRGSWGSGPKETPAPPRAPLPEELLERLERVDDPELRAAIAEAASLSLAATPDKKTNS